MLSREVIESEQFVSVFDQLSHGLFIVHAVGFHEEIKGRGGLCLRRGPPDVFQILLGPLVNDSGMAPRTFAASWILQRCSRVSGKTSRSAVKNRSAIAGGQLRRRVQATFLQTFQSVAPAVGILAEAVCDRQNVLLSIFIGAGNRQHRLRIAVQTDREVDPVGPDVDVAFALQIALAPDLILGPPIRLQPLDRRG